METINKFYLSAIVLTSIVLYATGRKPAHSVSGKAGRVALQMGTIGVAMLLVSMATQWTGNYDLLTASPIRDLILMTLISYCVVYWHERRWLAGAARFVGMSVWLALMLTACAWFWQTNHATLISAILIPPLLPLMRWIEKRLFSQPSIASPATPRGKLGAMHYASETFEIRHEAGTETLQVRCQLPANTAAGTSEENFDGSIPALHHASALKLGERWMPNVSCSWGEETVTRYTDNSTTTYIPGSTSTGFSSTGETVTVHTPGTTITIPGNKTYSFEEATGKFIARLYIVINKMGHDILVKGVSPQDKPAFDDVIKSIRSALEESCRQRNAQEIETSKAKIREQAEATRRAAETAQQAKREAQDNAHRNSSALLQQAGLSNREGDFFVDYQYGKNGTITSLLAADRDAHGILVTQNGADIWTGSWKGCEISYQQTEQEMHFKVVDEAYRRQHMKERRLVIRGWSHALCVEWQDRISLLNAA